VPSLVLLGTKNRDETKCKNGMAQNFSEGQLGKFIKMFATSSHVCYKAVKKAN